MAEPTSNLYERYKIADVSRITSALMSEVDPAYKNGQVQTLPSVTVYPSKRQSGSSIIDKLYEGLKNFGSGAWKLPKVEVEHSGTNKSAGIIGFAVIAAAAFYFLGQRKRRG